MKRFAKTIVKVLTAYATIVKKEFPEHLKEERIVRYTTSNERNIPTIVIFRPASS